MAEQIKMTYQQGYDIIDKIINKLETKSSITISSKQEKGIMIDALRLLYSHISDQQRYEKMIDIQNNPTKENIAELIRNAPRL